MIRREIPTLANYFADAGYKTILSGKWHLGDAYPHRPQDRGFQEVLSFRAWGLPSLASNWDNSFVNPDAETDSYHDPVLEVNGVDTPHKGYVTDIFFDNAMQQMARCKQAKKLFFLYLPTPTPHTPNIGPIDPERESFYKNVAGEDGFPLLKNKNTRHYYRMIENIDDNLGRLDTFLQKSGLKDNTILIYLSDNGTQSKEAAQIYNSGMQAHKRSTFEGGHRVPLFVRWKKGGLNHGRDIQELTQVQDLCPTLLELCGVQPDNLYPQNGHSLAPLLRGEPWKHSDRFIAIQYNSICTPWHNALALQGPWRLINAKLYNIHKDPGQSNDISNQHPEKVESMTASYMQWHKKGYREFLKVRFIDLGHPKAPETILYASDWDGGYCDNPKGLIEANKSGAWHVNVVKDGRYRFELSRWPYEAEKGMRESLNPKGKDTLGARPIYHAELQVYDHKQEKAVSETDKPVSFEMHLKAGSTKVITTLYDQNKNALCSAPFVSVKLVR
jgi:arylsulfatase